MSNSLIPRQLFLFVWELCPTQKEKKAVWARDYMGLIYLGLLNQLLIFLVGHGDCTFRDSQQRLLLQFARVTECFFFIFLAPNLGIWELSLVKFLTALRPYKSTSFIWITIKGKRNQCS